MARVSPLLANFTAGELSPLLDGRTDISRYFNGAKTIENFIILPYGGLKRRPGTYYINEVKDSARKSRLVTFQFSTTQSYIIEFADRVCRFYYNHGQLLSGASTYELTTPYLEADLFDLQFAQDADTMWITHPSYKPRKLTRNTPSWDTYTKLMLHCNGIDGSATFTDEIGKTVTRGGTAQIDTAQYKFGGASGLFDGDSDYLTSPDSADWDFGSGNFTIDFWVKLNALPGSGKMGSVYAQDDGVDQAISYFSFSETPYWALTFRNTENVYTSLNWSNGKSSLGDFNWHHAALVRNGNNYEVYEDGVSKGINTSDKVWKNMTDVVTLGRYGYVNDYFINGWIDEFRVSKGIARFTANFTPPIAAYAADVVTFSLNNYAPELLTLDVAPATAWIAGNTITGQTSNQTCVIVKVLTTLTYRIKDRTGAFTLGEVLTNGTVTADQGAAHPTTTGDPFGADDSDNCPACVSIHEQRIFFANTNNNPQKVWASVSGDFEDMTTGANAGDAFTYTIGSEQVNAIRWLSSGRVLGLGTLGGVFSLSSGADELVITPTNVSVKRETSYGSIGIVPKKIGNMVYFIQRNGKTVREFGYSYDVDEYTSFDTMLLAEHIMGDGIVDMDYQQSPYNILWCVRSDGVLSCLTRQIDQEVLGWARQIIGGNFASGNTVVESVAVIPGDGGDDEVWITVKRTIGGATKRFIEYFKPMDYGDEQEDGFFVDCGLTLDNPKPITAITKADPGVVTATGHGFSNDDIVIIRGVLGMTELNRHKYKVAGVSGDTFELTDASTGAHIVTTAYTTYISGGEVRKCVTSVSGLTHLAAETVDLFLDGDTATTAVVTAGGVAAITTPVNGGGEIHAGLRFTPYLKTMRIEAGSQLGTAQGKFKRISKVVARLHESLMVKIGNEDTQDEFNLRDEGDLTTDTIPVFSDDQEVMQPSLWDKNGYVVITQDGPYPLNVIAIIVYVAVSDD